VMGERVDPVNDGITKGFVVIVHADLGPETPP